MHELTMNGSVVQFNFGMGFLREVNKTVSAPVNGVPGATQNIGLQITFAKLIDGDVEALAYVLDTANKGCEPRLTKAAIDNFIESEDTDIDEVFDEVMGFLETANATKKTTEAVRKRVEEEKERQKNQE